MTGRVLIIEDDPDIAEALRYALEKESFSTRIASTGEEGLEASLDRTNPPTLILLDLLLPGMSGFEICRRLRKEPHTQRIPIVVISARAFEAEIRRTLQLGANNYILKPFLLSDVIASVRFFSS